jgi:hypothetical protein
MTNEKRIEIEQRIVRKYMKAMKDAGWIAQEQNLGDGLEAFNADDLFAADEATIVFAKDGKRAAIYFVYGNAPGEVVNDYHVVLEPVLAPVNQYAEQWA